MATKSNQFHCVNSSKENFTEAIKECLGALETKSLAPNLLLVFFNVLDSVTDDDLSNGLAAIHSALPGIVVAGVKVSGTVCNIQEQEDEVSVVVWAARFAHADPEVVHLQYKRTHEGGAFAGFPSELDRASQLDGTSKIFLLALADPFTFPMDLFLARINEEHPGMKVAGGMASASQSPGESRLICNRQIVNHGAVFVILKSPQTIATVVSQGCRPIGLPMVITKAERNQIFELGGKSAIVQFLAMYRELPTSEQRLIQSGLHVGIAISEFREKFSYGDFLIRNVLRIDEQEGSITLADYVRIGQTVQFHVRDQGSADSDLRQMLSASKSACAPFKPAAALAFLCNGRGTNLFDLPNHDAICIEQSLGSVPTAGFFAAGEIGSVGGQNFMHGFTASIVWFCE